MLVLRGALRRPAGRPVHTGVACQGHPRQAGYDKEVAPDTVHWYRAGGVRLWCRLGVTAASSDQDIPPPFASWQQPCLARTAPVSMVASRSDVTGFRASS